MRLFSIIFLISFNCIAIQGDFYTSISNLEHLLNFEELLVKNLEAYIGKVEKTNQLLRNYVSSVAETTAVIQNDIAEYFENPLNGFRIIHRFVSDWKDIEDMLVGSTDIDDYKRNVSEIQTHYKLSQDDLKGAVTAIVRLQETYELETEDVSNGILMDYETSPQMSASDCLTIGKTLYEIAEYRYAVEWLTQSRIRLAENRKTNVQKEDQQLSEARILEYLAPAYYYVKNYKMAASVNDELLALEPENAHGVSNGVMYQNSAQISRRLIKVKNEITKEPPAKPKLQDLYQKVCREELRQTPRQQRDLHCRYTTNNIPFCIVAPFKLEELSHDPPIFYYHQVIYENEMAKIINVTMDRIERSQIGTVSHSSFSEIRTSQTAWLYFNQHPFTHKLHQRLLDMTGLSLETAEPIQVVNYGIGGHYGPHFDFLEDDTEYSLSIGNRIATALFYINDVELGGGTAFPYLRLVVPPVKGSMVMWYNLHESLEFDYRTKHAACPVIRGSKWVCNEWFHSGGQEFLRPCTLEQQGHKSIKYSDANYLN